MADTSGRLRLALIAIDAREAHRTYDRDAPYFGTAVESLIEGLADCDELETHVITVTRRRMVSPVKLGRQIWFHSIVVPRWAMMRTFYFGAVRAIRQKLHTLKPDIVHGQGTERESALAAASSGFPNVITIHGNIREIARKRGARPFDFYWLAAKLEARAIRRAGGVICLSNYTRKLVDNLAARTWVIPNSAEGRFFQPRSIPAQPPLLLCVGRVEPLKNQQALLSALDAIASQIPFNCLFLGDLASEAEYGPSFQTEVAARPWASWQGHIGRDELASLMAKATALVHPSLEDNCPMVVLEAMASGVPVIASAIGGIPDLVRDGITGFLCDPATMETFATAITKLLQNPILPEQLGTAARAHADAYFRPTAIIDRHLAIYRELASVRA